MPTRKLATGAAEALDSYTACKPLDVRRQVDQHSEEVVAKEAGRRDDEDLDDARDVVEDAQHGLGEGLVPGAEVHYNLYEVHDDGGEDEARDADQERQGDRVRSIVTTAVEALTGVIAMESSMEPRMEVRLAAKATPTAAVTCE